MKVLAVIFLCAVAAVQGRSAGVQSTRSVAALGENPWLVHLRIAVSTSGFLNSCVGTLIHDRWVITAASCLTDARFVWVRYGVVDVISPTLVTETSTTRIHPEYNAQTGANNVALLSINRAVHSIDNISPIEFAQEVPSSGKFCGFGQTDDGAAGETLTCSEVTLDEEDDAITATISDGEISAFDVGAPVVSGNQQVGLVTDASIDGSAPVLRVSAYSGWIDATIAG